MLKDCFIFNNIKTGKTFFICYQCYDEVFRDAKFKKYFYERHIAGGISSQECLNCSLNKIQMPRTVASHPEPTLSNNIQFRKH